MTVSRQRRRPSARRAPRVAAAGAPCYPARMTARPGSGTLDADGIEVRPVRSRRDRRIFLTFPWRVYRGDPLWVPPLLRDRATATDPERGVFFKRGEADFFIAWRGGEPVGTICAAEDRALSRGTGKRECIFGFFEWLPGEEIARALMRRAARWARDRGIPSLRGPFNLDDEDAYGVLVEGRERPPVILCGHTPAYYLPYFEGSGFTPLRGDNIAYEVRLDRPSEALERTAVLAERIRRKGWMRIRTPNLDRWVEEVDVVHDLLNRSLAHLPDSHPWERDAVAGLLEPFRTLADPDLVLFVEADGKTIGFFPGIADWNEVLIHLGGLRRPWDYLRYLRWKGYRPRCLTIKSVLVPPEYWGGGAIVLMMDEMARRARAKGYAWVDLSLTSTDNPSTPELAERMGGRIYKRYRVYGRPVDEVLGAPVRA
jgi:GNAT superfamily N-acetyltransferase